MEEQGPFLQTYRCLLGSFPLTISNDSGFTYLKKSIIPWELPPPEFHSFLFLFFFFSFLTSTLIYVEYTLTEYEVELQNGAFLYKNWIVLFVSGPSFLQWFAVNICCMSDSGYPRASVGQFVLGLYADSRRSEVSPPGSPPNPATSRPSGAGSHHRLASQVFKKSVW